MTWETTRTDDPDVRERLVDAGWEVYHTVTDPATREVSEWRLRISRGDLDEEARTALPENQSYASLRGTDFASNAALELAAENDLNLSEGDFDDVDPSGETGYTKADVESIIGAEDE
jgi:hypothetical protein